jgi:hypothetical protein
MKRLIQNILVFIMTTTTEQYGRLGNQLIRNLAVSLIAEKFNLAVQYASHALLQKLGIPLFSGDHVYDTTLLLTDSNYFSIYQGETLDCNLNPNENFFQTQSIISVLYDYLQQNKQSVITKNPFKHRYEANHDLFVHIRLTDVAHFNPGLNYYLSAIQSIPFHHLYISTDDKTHSIVKDIVAQYPSAELMQTDELDTIQFASTCKYILLSHGSFSAVIGYLSFFSSVYYPDYESDKIWYGDMFSIPNWTKCKLI